MMIGGQKLCKVFPARFNIYYELFAALTAACVAAPR